MHLWNLHDIYQRSWNECLSRRTSEVWICLSRERKEKLQSSLSPTTISHFTPFLGELMNVIFSTREIHTVESWSWNSGSIMSRNFIFFTSWGQLQSTKHWIWLPCLIQHSVSQQLAMQIPVNRQSLTWDGKSPYQSWLSSVTKATATFPEVAPLCSLAETFPIKSFFFFWL